MTNTPTSAPSNTPNRLDDIVQRAEQQVNNPAFNAEFRAELQQLHLTQEDLSALAERFELSNVERIKNDARTIILEQVKQERTTLAGTIDKLTFKEQIGQTVLDIKKDFTESGPWTKAGYIAGGVVGFLAARWAWRKTRNFLFGSDAKEGILSKTGKWIAGIGAGIASIIGIQYFRNWLKTGTGAQVKQGIGQAAEGAEEGAKKVRTNFQEAFDTPPDPANFESPEEYHKALVDRVIKHGGKPPERKDFQSEAEYQKALEGMLEEYRKQGGNWAIVGDTIQFIGKNGWDSFVQMKDLANVAITVAQDPDKWSDAVAVYAEGIVLYVSSFALADVAFWSLVAGPKAGLIKGLTNSIGWPVSIVGKGWRAAGLILPGEGRARMAILKKAAAKGMGYNLNRLRFRELNPMGAWTAAHADDLFDEWTLWRNIDSELDKYKVSKSVIGHRQNVLLKKLQDATSDLIQNKGITPSFLQHPEANNLIEQIKAGHINNVNFEQTLDTLYKNPVATPLPQTPTPPSVQPLTEAADDAVESAATAKTTNQVKAAEALEEVSDEIKVALTEADDALQLPAGPARATAIEQVLNNPALAEAATVQPASSAARLNKAKNMIKSHGVGVGLTALGAAVDAYLIVDNWKQIKEAQKEGDLAKVDILQKRDTSLRFSGAGGVAVGGLETFGVISSGVALPLGIAIAGGTMTSETLYDYARDLNDQEKKYLAMSPAELISEIHNLTTPSPGHEVASSMVPNSENIERGRKRSLYHAYLLRTIAPHITAATVDRREAQRRFDTQAEEGKKLLTQRHGSPEKAQEYLLGEILYQRLTQYANKQTDILMAAHKVPLATDFQHLQDLASAWELQHALPGQNVLNLSPVPQPEQATSINLLSIEELTKPFEQYAIADIRSRYLVLRESAPEDAHAYLTHAILQRLGHAIMQAEYLITKSLSTAQANVARFELRTIILQNIDNLPSWMNDENAEVLLTHVKNISRNIAISTANPDALLKNALARNQKTPLQAALRSLLPKLTGGLINVDDPQYASMELYRKEFERRLGCPLEEALTNLVQPSAASPS